MVHGERTLKINYKHETHIQTGCPRQEQIIPPIAAETMITTKSDISLWIWNHENPVIFARTISINTCNSKNLFKQEYLNMQKIWPYIYLKYWIFRFLVWYYKHVVLQLRKAYKQVPNVERKLKVLKLLPGPTSVKDYHVLQSQVTCLSINVCVSSSSLSREKIGIN